MATRAQLLARRDGALVVVATIAGLGDGQTQWRLCTRVPRRYAAPPATEYRPYFQEGRFPNLLTEEAKILGGVANAGQVTLALVDVGDALTDRIRSNVRPFTRLVGAVSSTDLVIETVGALVEDTVVYVGLEAVFVEQDLGGNQYGVVRGILDTPALPHEDAARLYARDPFILNRRIRLYIAFDDEEGSNALEQEGEIGGGWHVDSYELDAGLNSWVFEGRSQLKYLDRQLLRSSPRGYVRGISPDGTVINLGGSITNHAGQPAVFARHFFDRIFVKNGDEILRLTPAATGVDAEETLIDARGVAGTYPEPLAEGVELRQVYTADPREGFGSFRIQLPGAETDLRTTGTWTPQTHPVPILLACFTSPADPRDDGPTNYTPGKGNFSALPGGVGVGIEASEISFDTFFDVWQRTPTLTLENLVIDETIPARTLAERICMLCGFHLSVQAGLLTLELLRIPLAGELGAALWEDRNVVTMSAGVGNEVATLSAVKDSRLAVGTVIFEARTARGVPVESKFDDASFPEVFGDPRGYYEGPDRRIEIDARYVRIDSTGAEPEILRQRALFLLRFFRNPLWRLRLRTDLSQDEISAGAIVRLSHEQLPDDETGARGWSGVPVKLETKRQVITEDTVHIEWEGISFGTGQRTGRICPSGMIAGSPVGNDVTIEDNRYTDPTSATLPTTDTDAFTVGDRVVLTSRDGAVVATTPSFQTVTGIAAPVLTLDGNFGGALEFDTGTVIEFVERDDQVEQQHTRFVSLADEISLLIGTTSDPAWRFSEP